MNLFWIGLALFLIYGAGLGLLMILTSPKRRVGVLEAFALSWLLGTAFISMAQFAFGFILAGIDLYGLVALFCLGLFGIGVKRARSRVQASKLPQGGTGRLLLVIVAGQALFVCWLASRAYFGWDGLAVWEIKARACFLNGGLPDRSFFTDLCWEFAHPNYPLYLPLVESWIYWWVGSCDQSIVRVIFPPFYLSAIVLLGSGAGRLTANPMAKYIAPAILFFLPLMFSPDAGVLSGYADFPLGVFYLASAVYLIAFLNENQSTDLRLALALGAVMPWIKEEGGLLWLCLSLIAIVHLKNRLRYALAFPLPGFAVIGLWAISKAILHVPRQNVFIPVSVGSLVSNLDRCVPIAYEAFFELTKIDNWSFFWPGVGCALLQIIYLRKRCSGAILVAVFIPLALDLSIYLFTTWDFLRHMALSFPRLLLQIAPIGILAIAMALPCRPAVGETSEEKERELIQ